MDCLQMKNARFPLEKNVSVVLVTEEGSLKEEMERFIVVARKLRPDIHPVLLAGKTRKVIGCAFIGKSYSTH
eukprot:scaffold176963_cov22-Prasinocladus_malaysianus.AAC.1